MTQEQPHAWVSVTAWWHAAFALSVAVTALLIGLGPGEGSTRLAALGCVGGLVVAYATVGRRCVDPTTDGTAATLWRYAAPAVALLLVGLMLSPGPFSLLFVLPAQFFAGAPTFRAAVPAVLLLVAAGAVGQARWMEPAFTAEAWGRSVGQFAIIGAFSLGMGAFISRIIEQSSERAELIDELRRTRADLDAAQHAAGVQAERQRLAHDIHDTLAQGFTSIVVLAQTAAAVTAGEHPAHRALGAIEDTARQNLAEARALVAELTPPALAAGSLAAAGQRLVAQAGHDAGLRAEWAVEGEVRPLPANTEVALLRALQEALTNVRRHAAATSVRATLAYDAGSGCVRLVVADDGVGFEPATVAAGFGLPGMRSRLEQVGGTLHVDTGPGRGARLVAEVAAP